MPAPPRAIERGSIHITPIRSTGRTAAGRANQRRELLENVSSVLDDLQNAQSDVIYQREFRQPTPLQLGTGASFLETQRQMDALMRFLSAASLDTDWINRTNNAVRVGGLLENNERLLIDIVRNPERYGVTAATDLEAIILSEPFVLEHLGRRPMGGTTARTIDPSAPRRSRGDWERIQRAQREALSATRVHLPRPMMLTHPDLHALMRRFGYNPRGARQ